MGFPNEKLDDFRGSKTKRIDPPAKVNLEFTGESEVLKPLAHWDGPIKPSLFHRLSWFHRSLAMAGAITVVTFLLGTGLYLAVYGPPVEPTAPDEVAFQQQSDDSRTAVNDSFTFDQPARVNLPPAPRKYRSVPAIAKRRPVQVSSIAATYRSQYHPVQPQMWVSQFVPTTMVIYIENGVVRSRIEPQLAADKKPGIKS